MMDIYDVNFAKVKDQFKKMVPEYESPISTLTGELHTEIIKKQEDDFVTIVSQTLGYSVDKKELIDALHYDRYEFHKGYESGKAAGYNKILDILAKLSLKLYERSEYYYKEAMKDAMEIIKEEWLEEEEE